MQSLCRSSLIALPGQSPGYVRTVPDSVRQGARGGRTDRQDIMNVCLSAGPTARPRWKNPPSPRFAELPRRQIGARHPNPLAQPAHGRRSPVPNFVDLSFCRPPPDIAPPNPGSTDPQEDRRNVTR